MAQLSTSLWEFFSAAAALAGIVMVTAGPLIPVVLFAAFWLWAVDWQALRPLLTRGGWIGGLLIAVLAALVWTAIDGPARGPAIVFGLSVSPFVGKFVMVSGLVVLLQLCGAAQLAGLVSGPVEPTTEETSAALAASRETV
jgi:hypothetical protein